MQDFGGISGQPAWVPQRCYCDSEMLLCLPLFILASISPGPAGRPLLLQMCSFCWKLELLANICRSLEMGGSDQQGSKDWQQRGLGFLLFLDPCWCPCVCPSHASCSAHSPFPGHERSLNSGPSEDGFEETPKALPLLKPVPHSINETFLTAN